jgi:hypothetical protein
LTDDYIYSTADLTRFLKCIRSPLLLDKDLVHFLNKSVPGQVEAHKLEIVNNYSLDKRPSLVGEGLFLQVKRD